MITKEEREMNNEEEDSIKDELLKIQGYLYRYAYKLTCDTEKAKDLLQDTSLKILFNKDKYVRNDNFRGWACMVMKNIFLNKNHKENRICSLEDYDIERYSVNIPHESGLGIQDVICTIEDINKALSSFSNIYSLPISMYISGCKYEDIATLMNLPIGTVKSRIFYARKKLQILLKDYREDY